MRIKFLNRNKTITAGSDEDVVTWMRTNDLERYRTNDDFMKAYSDRKRMFENIEIATGDAGSFIKDLERHGIIGFVKNNLFTSFKKGR